MFPLLVKLEELSKKIVSIGIQGEAGEQKKIRQMIPKKQFGREYSSRLTVTDNKAIRGKKLGILMREIFQPDGKVTVFQVARAHEKGLGVPKRSFIASTLQENKESILKLAKALVLKDPEKALGILGLHVTNLIRKKIISGIPPPLAKSTLEFKGEEKSTPLINTGQLKNSITFKIEDA